MGQGRDRSACPTHPHSRACPFFLRLKLNPAQQFLLSSLHIDVRFRSTSWFDSALGWALPIERTMRARRPVVLLFSLFLGGALLDFPGIPMNHANIALAKKKRKRRRGRKARKRTQRRSSANEPRSTPKNPEPANEAPAQTPQFRGPTRIDFDDRLIQGQTNKSGAVYLFDRKESGISSMVRRRKSFKRLTIKTIFDQ